MIPSKEEIEKDLGSVEDELEKIDLLNYYGSSIYQDNDEFAYSLVLEALQASRRLDYKKGIAQALLNKATILAYREKYEQMYRVISESELLLRQLPDSNKLGLSRAVNCKAVYYHHGGDYRQAAFFFQEALELCKDAGNFGLMSSVYNNLSVIYEKLGQNEKACEYAEKAYKIACKVPNFYYQVIFLCNIGVYSNKLGNYSKSLAVVKDGYKLALEKNIVVGQAMALFVLCETYMELEEYKKAEEAGLQCLELSVSRGFPREETRSLIELGTLYVRTGELDKAEEYLLKASVRCSQLSIKDNDIQLEKQLDKLYCKKGDFEKAHYHLERYCELVKKSLDNAVNIKMVNSESESLKEAHDRIKIISAIGRRITSSLDLKLVFDLIYEQINTLMDAALFGIARINFDLDRLEYDMFVEEGVRLKPSYCSLDDPNSLAALAIRERKDIIINDFSKEYSIYVHDKPFVLDAKVEKIPQSILCCPLIGSERVKGAIMVESFEKNAYTMTDLDSLKALASYVAIAIRNANQTKLIQAKNEQLSSANSQIITSIKYAQKIQYSILPSRSILQHYFADSFLLYNPRDIVGGDFYWFKKDQKGFLCVVGDCTGHGIPGAFMVMAVNALLTKVNIDKIHDNPALLLGEINSLLKVTLKQEGKILSSKIDDGADLAVCFIPDDKSRLFFAGAKLSLIYVENGKVYEKKGDHMSIGYKESTTDFHFTNHTIPLSAGTSYYLTTDGYYDQIGGAKGFPMGRKIFKKLLKSLEKKSMFEQKEILEQEFAAYKGDESQVDDVTVLGFAF